MFPRVPIRACIFSIILLVTFSCTIIQDGDVKSLSELSALKWKGLEIKQETNNGNSSTLAELVYDSVKNVADPVTGAQIVRKVKFNLPSVAGKKMTLRSKSTANTSFFVAYKANNQPAIFWIQEKDSVIESTYFFYNTSNTLYKIRTRVNPVDGLAFLVATNDSLIYDNTNKITSIIRKSPDATRAGTIAISYQNALISTIGFKYNYQSQSGNCSNGNNSNACGAYSIQPASQSFNPQINYQFQSISTLLSQIELIDHRFDSNNSGCQGCGRELDTFYLHPFMLTKNEFTLGNELLMIYMVDWWVAGTASTTASLSKNDMVTLIFQYGH